MTHCDRFIRVQHYTSRHPFARHAYLQTIHSKLSKTPLWLGRAPWPRATLAQSGCRACSSGQLQRICTRKADLAPRPQPVLGADGRLQQGQVLRPHILGHIRACAPAELPNQPPSIATVSTPHPITPSLCSHICMHACYLSSLSVHSAPHSRSQHACRSTKYID